MSVQSGPVSGASGPGKVPLFRQMFPKVTWPSQESQLRGARLPPNLALGKAGTPTAPSPHPVALAAMMDAALSSRGRGLCRRCSLQKAESPTRPRLGCPPKCTAWNFTSKWSPNCLGEGEVSIE